MPLKIFFGCSDWFVVTPGDKLDTLSLPWKFVKTAILEANNYRNGEISFFYE